MNKLVQDTAERELDRAILADEQANSHYYQILRRFITKKSALSEEKPCQPDTKLDAGGLKLIDAAWLALQYTEKKLRSAYMKLYVAYL
jgi:hypothetical protein